MSQTSIRKDFLRFVKRPDYVTFDEYTTSKKLIVLLKVFVIRSLILLVPGLVLSVFELLGLYDGIEMISTKIYEFEENRNSEYTIYIFILGVFIMPVLEEIAFRLPLKRFDITSILLSISVLLGLILTYLVSEYLWWPEENILFFLTNLLYLFSIIGLIYAILNLLRDRIFELEYFWNNNPTRICYLSVTLFAFMHVFNLNIEARDLIFLPIILTIFLINGVAFGYLRVRLGLFYAILMHIAINGLSFTIN